MPSEAPARIPYASCPLCGCRSSRSLGRFDCTAYPTYKAALPAWIHWLRCEGCAHVHTDGHFNAAALDLLLQDSHPGQEPGAQAEWNRNLWSRLVTKVAALKPAGRWLDVGFGNGALLFAAAEWGYATLGLDLRPATVAGLCALGFEGHCRPLAEHQDPDGFDVLSLCDTLEHAPFPAAELDHARRLLKPDGLLVLSMPNMDCMAWRLLDAEGANPYWCELEHYHNFTRARLCALLEERGFEPVLYGVSDRYRLGMEVVARKSV